MSKFLKAAVLGHPIDHSLSPRLHRHWLKFYKMEGSYEAVETLPEKLAETLNRLQDDGYAGVNLTVPLKEKALALMDDIDPIAARIGAVNTVTFREGKKQGWNTDAYGFVQNLESLGYRIQNSRKAVVLGAGGAARAIIAGLLDVGVKRIVLSNRSREKAEELVKSLAPASDPQALKPVSWTDRHISLADADLVINTTSLGMQGQPELDIYLDRLPVTGLVVDIVYNPLQTPLLYAARQRGNLTVDGLGMLIFQGQKAFEHFFGKLPPVTEALRQEMRV